MPVVTRLQRRRQMEALAEPLTVWMYNDQASLTIEEVRSITIDNKLALFKASCGFIPTKPEEVIACISWPPVRNNMNWW